MVHFSGFARKMNHLSSLRASEASYGLSNYQKSINYHAQIRLSRPVRSGSNPHIAGSRGAI
ncbi:MAG: hypothetical protein U5L45_13100 [Saprospiraceae bacterium]|nr:hypothetical protein [Saprospiraceae bacterium]